jgi:UDP-N-acetylglucosamine:LPS N-acetylglucosamine transferase
MKQKKKFKKNILMISSSGGHFEQLNMLRNLKVSYNLIYVTEKTKYHTNANHYLLQTGRNDIGFILFSFLNLIISIILLIKYRPKYIITTGAAVAIPIAITGYFFKVKLIFIETIARVNDSTKTANLLYRYSDLFIVQWKELLEIFPNAEYGGSIY